MDIVQSETRKQFPLSNKKIIKKTLTSTVAWVFFLIVLWVFLMFTFSSVSQQFNQESLILSWSWITTFVILVLLIASVLLIYYYQCWYFATYFYELDPDYIVIRKGPITPREITVPYERFQDVYVDQDIWDRIFGLYDVHISSATISSGMEAHIDGVEKQAADGLKAILLQKINEKIGKKTPATDPQS